MAKKRVSKRVSEPKVEEKGTVVCRYLGDANVHMVTLPRASKVAFKDAFLKKFRDAVTERDSSKIRSGVFCDADTGTSPYATIVLVVPPLFPSRLQEFLVAFSMANGLQIKPYIPDHRQE